MNFIHFQDPGTSYSTLMDKRKSDVRILSNLILINLTEPLYIVEKHKKSRNFEHFQLENPKSSTLQDESKTHTPKFEKFGQINAALYFICLYSLDSNLSNLKQMKFIPILCKPHPFSPQLISILPKIFSQSNCSCKNLNQFEPV